MIYIILVILLIIGTFIYTLKKAIEEYNKVCRNHEGGE